MTESSRKSEPSTPKHLWIVGILGFLWSCMGSMIYLMYSIRNEEYMQSFTPEQLAFFDAYPGWFISMWAIGVWGGVVGCFLLLLRKGAAVWVLGASLAGVVITNFRNYALANGLEVIGTPADLTIASVVLVVSIALLAYARAMKARGVLR